RSARRCWISPSRTTSSSTAAARGAPWPPGAATSCGTGCASAPLPAQARRLLRRRRQEVDERGYLVGLQRLPDVGRHHARLVARREVLVGRDDGGLDALLQRGAAELLGLWRRAIGLQIGIEV